MHFVAVLSKSPLSGQDKEVLLMDVPNHMDWQACRDGHIYRRDGSRLAEYRKEAGENRLRVSCKTHGYHYVAKLLARAFFGPDADSQAVVHINGDPSDNRLSNLRLVREAGSNSHCKGSRRLSLARRQELHRLLHEGMAQTAIACELRISPRCVRYHATSCQCSYRGRVRGIQRRLPKLS